MSHFSYKTGDEIYSSHNDLNIVEYVRERRNELLAECDWTQAADSPLSDQKKAEWATYRQQLRDLTNSYTKENSIEDIVFPTKPT